MNVKKCIEAFRRKGFNPENTSSEYGHAYIYTCTRVFRFSVTHKSQVYTLIRYRRQRHYTLIKTANETNAEQPAVRAPAKLKWRNCHVVTAFKFNRVLFSNEFNSVRFGSCAQQRVPIGNRKTGLLASIKILFNLRQRVDVYFSVLSVFGVH